MVCPTCSVSSSYLKRGARGRLVCSSCSLTVLWLSWKGCQGKTIVCSSCSVSSGYLKRGARGRLVCPLFFGFLKRKPDLSVLNMFSDYFERDASGGLVCPQCSLLHARRMPAEDLSVLMCSLPHARRVSEEDLSVCLSPLSILLFLGHWHQMSLAFYQHIPHNNITVFTYDPVRIFIQTTFCVIHWELAIYHFLYGPFISNPRPPPQPLLCTTHTASNDSCVCWRIAKELN